MVARSDDQRHILQGEEAAVPEEVGSRAAKQLFEEVSRGGAVDSTHQVHCRQMVATTLRPLGHSGLGAGCCTEPGWQCASNCTLDCVCAP
jgi:hypothetical protein